MQKRKKPPNHYVMIVIGTAIVAFGINWFLAPFGIVTGGISGIGIILEGLSESLLHFKIPLALTNIVLNLPLFMIAIRQRGFLFARKSVFAVLMLSLWLSVVSFIPNPFGGGEDLFVSALFGGALSGIGIGFVLRSGASTGGTDMLASIIRFKYGNLPIARLMLMIDGAVLIAGLFTFGADKAVYAISAVIVSTRMVSNILDGLHYAKAAFIISKESECISKDIMQKLPRGVTALSAKGMYTKAPKDVLFVIVAPKEITKLRMIIHAVDPKAFVAITDIREVLGQGFVEDYNAIM